MHLSTFRTFRSWLLIALASVLVAPAAAQPLPVVASFSVLADLVRVVGGSHVEVTSLVAPNSDAHVFDPTPADAKRLANAKLVVINGLGFEGWMDRLIKSSGYRGSVVVASRGIKTIQEAAGHGHQHGHSHSHAADPHAWQNPLNIKQYVQNIRVALAAAKPEAAQEFEQRATAYSRELDALDQSIRERFKAIPVAQRRIITSHDAFGYFAAAYNVKFYPLQGLSTGSEPSAADVVRIIDQIKKNKVTAIFVENISDSRVLERLTKESGARIGGTLYADALSEPGTAMDTYLKMIEHNAATIIKGLSPRQ
ncbi:zinc ABC transporter substrate-binding protein [Alcaligenaceae bacterium LF4-65]|uniref:Zinc ABC transporter substrate-binding protein n=1 Tax=Zwartia hollandica TaxID=324606 RepID=A0A953NCU2_9BURK|nr:zinc ABC transporter substrate-binding protein [Zwartia hollandica]MBZ1351998.1 zinc ABC transporter substrate-binding protein [Zwartia hollandica]